MKESGQGRQIDDPCKMTLGFTNGSLVEGWKSWKLSELCSSHLLKGETMFNQSLYGFHMMSCF